MIGRWYTQLAAYDLDITYVSGKTQVTADPLSRILLVNFRQETAAAKDTPSTVAKVLARVASLHTDPALKSSVQTERAWISALPGNIKCPDHVAWDVIRKFLSRQFTVAHLARNIPRAVWASHQRKDPSLGPIYSFLSSTASTPLKSVTPKVRVNAQSYRLIDGILHYRSI